MASMMHNALVWSPRFSAPFPLPLHGPIDLPPSVVREQKLAKQRCDEETAAKQREQEQERLRRMCKKKKRRTRRKHRNLNVAKK